jgi:hypothetical protein
MKMWMQMEEVIKLAPTIAVILSALTLLASLQKNRNLRIKEYADRVRRSAALIAARADRWRQLSLSLFQDIQVQITEADVMLVEECDIRRVRDFFWRELFVAQRIIAKKLVDEQIEISYAELFGYDSKIHELFDALVKRLAAIDRLVFAVLLTRTQDDILAEYKEGGGYVSADLGNQLRATVEIIHTWCGDLLDGTVGAFRDEMAKIVTAKDKNVARRDLELRASSEVFVKLGAIELPPEAKRKEVSSNMKDNVNQSSDQNHNRRGDRDPGPFMPSNVTLSPPPRGGGDDDG